MKKDKSTSSWILILFSSLFSFFAINQDYLAQGLPTSGNAKLLIIYSDVKDSSTFSFNPSDLSEMLKDFYSEMSF
ncbi:MAG: hypothetical protein R3250_09855, partial [Melioribacteraceae bacterium]|nr:hypothetical protein [Melioribacteraceae bacterium]